jgi:hypothetical protein
MVKGGRGIFQNGIVQNYSFPQNRNLSEWNLSEEIFLKILLDPTGIFRNGIFQKESLIKYVQQNRNLSEWNFLIGIFQKQLCSPTGISQKESFRMESFRIISAKPEPFRMESFRRNLSKNNLQNWTLFRI